MPKTRSNVLSGKKSNIKKVKVCNLTEQSLKENLMAVHVIAENTAKNLSQIIEGRYKLIVEPTAPSLSIDMLEAMSMDYKNDKFNDIRTNTVTNLGVADAVRNNSFFQKINYSYSHELKLVPKATQQDNTGRCWLFAALNSMRLHIMEMYNLPDHFELSEAYLFFWDKLERSHHFLTMSVKHRNMDTMDPKYQFLMCNMGPKQDGGNWSYVVNLIEKYGIIPKTLYGETFNSSYSDEMNELLHSRLVVFNDWIRRHKNMSDKELYDVVIKQMIPDMYQLISNCLGEAPFPETKLTWQYNESSHNFESVRQKGQYHRVECTPLSYYNDYVVPHYPLNEMILISDDPRMKQGQTYTVEFDGSMVGGLSGLTYNVGIKELKRAVARSVMDNTPVWFTCDVNRDFDPFTSILSTDAFPTNHFFKQEFHLDKAKALEVLSSYPTHAMSIVGLDTVDNNPDLVTKWKIENSWGSWTDQDPGYLQIHNDWFDRYVFTAVVNKKYLSPEYMEKLKQCEYDPVKLPYNDPFGSVASMKK